MQLKLRRLRRSASVADGVRLARTFFWKLPEGRVGLKIGRESHLDGRIVVRGNGLVTIGDHCSFRAGTYVGCVNLVTIGSNVFGSENVFITDNNNHPVSARARRKMTETSPGGEEWSWLRDDVDSAPVTIEDDVWLGRNSMILKGVTIGRGSIVAAGTVVVKTAAPFSIIAGNPGRVVKQIPNDLDKTI